MQPSQINLSPGVTSVSQDIYSLHMAILLICVGIGIIVFSILIYALIYHRKSRRHKPATFHSHATIEWVWAIIPFLILAVMAIFATRVLKRMDDNTHSDLNIKITGYQWKWRYEYLDHKINFFSNLSTPIEQIQGKAAKNQWYLLEVDKPLVIPIHKKIRFLITSNDVIHGWWVPAFGVKADAIPGFIHEAWARVDKPGTYRGQCAELCGLHHAYMPIVVIAKTQADFDKWVAEQTGAEVPASVAAAKPDEKKAAPAATKTFTKEELMAEGKKVYETTCAVCHKPDGTGMPPAFPSLIKSKTMSDVNAHINIVMNGKPGTAMQAFKDQMNDEQLAAVITYERNSWGNPGGMVQPDEIAKRRK